MELLTTCKKCGVQNRVAAIPQGRVAVCGNCRGVLGEIQPPDTTKQSGGLSGTAWAWIGLLSIGLISWGVNSSQSSTRSVSPSSGFAALKQPPPIHQTITRLSTAEPVAPLEIRSSPGTYFLVKLTDLSTHDTVLTVFIHGGQTATFDVPLGTYEIKYASGLHWYGSKHLFGPETTYSKADSSFEFKNLGYQISGYTITLYEVANGNLSTSPIFSNDF